MLVEARVYLISLIYIPVFKASSHDAESVESTIYI